MNRFRLWLLVTGAATACRASHVVCAVCPADPARLKLVHRIELVPVPTGVNTATRLYQK
jgi:hypothetical protein